MLRYVILQTHGNLILTENYSGYATGLNWVSMQSDAEIRNYAYRISYIDTYGFNLYGCYILKTPVSSNQFNTTFSYPNLNLFEYSPDSQNPELYISVCKQMIARRPLIGECPTPTLGTANFIHITS